MSNLMSEIDLLKQVNANLKKANDSMKIQQSSSASTLNTLSPLAPPGSINLEQQVDNLIKEKAALQKQLDSEKQENMSLLNKIELAKLTSDNLSCQIDVIKQEKAELKLQVEDWKQDSEFFQLKLEETKSDLDQMQLQYDSLQKEKKRLVTQLSESKNLNDTTQGKLQALLKQFTVSEQTVTDLNHQITEISKEKDRINQKLLDKTRENNDLSKKLSEMSAAVSKGQQDSMKASEKSKDEIKKLKNLITEMKNSKHVLSDQINQLQSENLSLKEENTISSDRLLSLKTTINDQSKELMEQIKERDAQIEKLKEEILIKDSELKKGVEENKDLKTQVAEHSKTIDSLNNRIKEDLSKRIDNANAKGDSSQGELQEIIDALRKELNHNTEQIKSLQKLNTEYSNEIKTHKANENDLREKQNQLIKISKALQQTNSDLTKKLQEKDENPNNSDPSDISHLKAREEELLKEIDNLKKVSTSESKLQSQVTKYSEQVAKLKSEKNALRSKLLSIVTMCKTLQKVKNELLASKTTLSNNLKEANSRLENANNLNTELHNEIEKLKESNSKLISTNKTLKQSNANSSKLLTELDKARLENAQLAEQLSKANRNSEQALELSRLQNELKKKKTEIEELKKQNKKSLSKLQQENDSLRFKQKELKEHIHMLENKDSDDSLSDSSELRPPKLTDLRRQNDMLKRKNDLITQNFELEKIEMQTNLEQKDALIRQLQTEVQTHRSASPSKATSNEIDRLKSENSRLRERIARLSSSKGGSSKYLLASLSTTVDDLRSRSTKFQFAISRLFSQISSRLLAMNSRVSFLQYRLKLKRNKRDSKVPHKLNNILQLLGIPRRSRASVDQLCDDVYKAVSKMRDKRSEKESFYQTLAPLVGMEGFDEPEILAAVQKRLKSHSNIEAKYSSAKNQLKNIRKLLQKERNNDLFAEAVRQLFVNQ